MSLTSHIRLMAHYNEWMNAKLYAAAATLTAQQLAENRGAFFGSLLGTMNHIVVADTIWLTRFLTHPAAWAELEAVRALPQPAALDQLLYGDLPALHGARCELDAIIVRWAGALRESELDHVLHYANSKGVVSDKLFHSLVMHFFNHQTHHRGQATTLLSQAGADIGSTDLLGVIPNQRAP
ncbi:MAG: DinB family protein [Pseudomonadota bacterium]